MQGDKYQDNELSSSILRSQYQHQFSSTAPLTSGTFQSDALPFGGNETSSWKKHSDESSTNELCSTQFSIPSVRLSSARLSLTESSLSSSSFLWDFEDQIPLNQIVHPALSMVSGQQYYSMSSRPRGFCLIINNVEFIDQLNYPKRIGSDEEAQRLANVFSQLYFEVIHRRNLTHSEMLTTLHSIASHRSLIKHDALVVIILSHGSSGAIFGSDNRPIAFEHLLTIFNNQNCPLLIKKPKMFFFNCCRGSAQDFGPKITTRTLNGSFNHIKSYQSELELTSSGEDDVIDAAMFPHVPTVSDMMICFSTIDGYVSWRNEQHGTWFGSALSRALAIHACHYELNQILSIAAELVQRRMTKQGAKQAIEWKYRAWTKALYFNPSWCK